MEYGIGIVFGSLYKLMLESFFKIVLIIEAADLGTLKTNFNVTIDNIQNLGTVD